MSTLIDSRTTSLVPSSGLTSGLSGARSRFDVNDQLFSQDNIEVVGNNNDVHGNDCTVVGKYNSVYGRGCTIFGTNNEVFTDGEGFVYYDYGVNTLEYKKVGRNYILVKGVEEKGESSNPETKTVVASTVDTVDLTSESSTDLDTLESEDDFDVMLNGRIRIEGGDRGTYERMTVIEEPTGEEINMEAVRDILGVDPAIRNNIYPIFVSRNGIESTSVRNSLGNTDPCVSRELIAGLAKHSDSVDTDLGQKCCVCMENRSIVAFNCGHKKTCKGCSVKILKEDGRCPFCRESIVIAIRIFD